MTFSSILLTFFVEAMGLVHAFNPNRASVQILGEQSHALEWLFTHHGHIIMLRLMPLSLYGFLPFYAEVLAWLHANNPQAQSVQILGKQCHAHECLFTYYGQIIIVPLIPLSFYDFFVHSFALLCWSNGFEACIRSKSNIGSNSWWVGIR